MIIKISDLKWEKVFFIRKLFAFSAIKKINESWMIKVSFPDSLPGLEEFVIKKGHLIQAFLPDERKKVYCVFSGYIEERGIAGNVVSLVGYDFIGYLKHRMIRNDSKFNNQPIKSIVETLFANLEEISPLPFALRKNDCEDQINIEFKAYTSFYTILKELAKKVDGLAFRHSSEVELNASKEYVDISKETWVLRPWMWVDNANIQQRNSKVISRERKDSFWNFCNYWKDHNGNEKRNEESIAEGLLFEKYEKNPEKTPDALQEGAWLVKIVPELNKSEITQLQVGDRKAIRLITRLSWVRFEYVGIIQEINLSSNGSGGIDFSVKIGEKVIEQKNILDKTLYNLALKLWKLDK